MRKRVRIGSEQGEHLEEIDQLLAEGWNPVSDDPIRIPTGYRSGYGGTEEYDLYIYVEKDDNLVEVPLEVAVAGAEKLLEKAKVPLKT